MWLIIHFSILLKLKSLDLGYEPQLASKKSLKNKPWFNSKLVICCYLQEERIATLEKRYLNSQRESTTLRDLNEKLEQELKNKEDQSVLTQEKIKAISEKLDISEQKLIEFASMPDIEEQLRDRMEALTQVRAYW